MYRGLKRVYDMVGALVLLLLFAPALVLIAILLMAGQGRPIFFLQVRPGLNERPFKIIKFRTVRSRDNAHGVVAGTGEITLLGQYLRRFSIDELPQLVNILIGDMSFVGPRPLLTEYLEIYTDEQRKRHSVRPGLTGLAQVEGRNSLTWGQKLDLDLRYCRGVTFQLDFRILAKSVMVVLTGKGFTRELA